VAYQGALGLDPAMLLALNERLAPRPDLLVLLDIEPAVGLDRVHARGDKADLFENVQNLEASRAIFNGLQGDFILRLDATRPADELAQEVRDALLYGPLLRRLCPDAAQWGTSCSHLVRGGCAWSRMAWHDPRPLPRFDDIIADDGAPIGTRLERIVARAAGRE
jgi:hypothetical protein